MEDKEIFELVREIEKQRSAAQESFYNALKEVRLEGIAEQRRLEERFVEMFQRAHDENKEALTETKDTLKELTATLEKMDTSFNGRVSSLEHWRAGLVAVFVFAQALWIGFLAFWKNIFGSDAK